MCDPVKAVQRAFTPAGTGGVEARAEAAAATNAAELQKQTAALQASALAQQQQTDIAQQSAQDALDAQRAAAAAVPKPTADSEAARQAADKRLRQLLAAAGPQTFSRYFGEPPVGFRVLTGQ